MRPHKGACDACRSRKVQCYGLPPPCTRCKHHAISCTFEHAGRATSRARTVAGLRTPKESINDRIQRIEQALLSAQGNSLALSPLAGLQISSQAPAREPRAKVYFAGHHVGHIGSFTGIPFISPAGKAWIQECIGQKEPVDAICNIGLDWQASVEQADTAARATGDNRPPQNFELPARRAVEHLFALYSCSGFSRMLYLVEPVLFKRTLAAAYMTPTIANAGARAHVLAFILMVDRVQHESSGPKINAELCEKELMHLLPHVLGEPDSSSPETFLMLMIYYVARGKEEQGYVYHSVACRHLFSLGSHVDPAHRSERASPSDDEGISDLSKQHLRRLFWIAYWCDGDLSLRTGRPPAIDEDYCDLTLPTGSNEVQHPPGKSNTNLKLDPRVPFDGLGFSVADLELTMIQSRVVRRLYSASALRKTDAETLCAVRELDEELERWRASVPDQGRPTLTEDMAPTVSKDRTQNFDVWIRRSARQLNYLHLVAIIHQASSHCRQWTQNTGAEHLQGISSSIAISLHASRATLHHMNSVMSHDNPSNIWAVLFYPVSAALNIFCNILLDPLSPSVDGDLLLISSTSDLLVEFTKRSERFGDAAWSPHLDTFITELARLGRMAVARAKEQAMHGSAL